MQIVPQSASPAYSPIPRPPIYLLAAPRIPLALPAPRPVLLLCAPVIAGLLPDRIPFRLNGWRIERAPVPPKAETFEDVLRETGPLQTMEELDAEIYEMLMQSKERMRRNMAELEARQAARRKAVWS